MAEPLDEAPAILEFARREVDANLSRVATRLAADHPGDLGAALGYAVQSPGKRIRPALMLAAYEAAGGRPRAGVAGIATAIEIVHTYSLVHDDLPCMDDDQLRRGRATTHVAFGVAAATRVGYLLVPVAAEELARAAQAMGLSDATVAELAGELFEAGGIRGMVGGQWLDLEAEGRRLDLPGLVAVHRGKTGALIAAAAILGGIAADAPAATIEVLRRFGREIGLAFQVADDVLDATATSHQLGKTAGKDAELAKSTYVGLLGVEGARAEAERHCRQALAILDRSGLPAGTLATLARYIVTRSS